MSFATKPSTKNFPVLLILAKLPTAVGEANETKEPSTPESRTFAAAVETLTEMSVFSRRQQVAVETFPDSAGRTRSPRSSNVTRMAAELSESNLNCLSVLSTRRSSAANSTPVASRPKHLTLLDLEGSDTGVAKIHFDAVDRHYERHAVLTLSTTFRSVRLCSGGAHATPFSHRFVLLQSTCATTAAEVSRRPV